MTEHILCMKKKNNFKIDFICGTLYLNRDLNFLHQNVKYNSVKMKK